MGIHICNIIYMKENKEKHIKFQSHSSQYKCCVYDNDSNQYNCIRCEWRASWVHSASFSSCFTDLRRNPEYLSFSASTSLWPHLQGWIYNLSLNQILSPIYLSSRNGLAAHPKLSLLVFLLKTYQLTMANITSKSLLLDGDRNTFFSEVIL